LIESAFPIISTRDLRRLLEFYQDLFGGSVTYQFPSDGSPEFVSLGLGESTIGIAEDSNVSTSSDQRFSLWVYVEDCDRIVELVRHRGLEVIEEPADQRWGERVARVADPDGNLVIVGQRQEHR
jgi:lactoylglutathione lyase